MAYSEELAERVRGLLATEPALTEQKMFGGLGFMVGGHMAVAAAGRGGLMVRCDPAASEQLVAQPHVERMVMQGREMSGWLLVAAPGVRDDGDLDRWVRVGVDLAHSLPPK